MSYKGKIYVEHNSPRDEITYEGVGSTCATGLVINHVNFCLEKKTFQIMDDGSIYVLKNDMWKLIKLDEKD